MHVPSDGPRAPLKENTANATDVSPQKPPMPRKSAPAAASAAPDAEKASAMRQGATRRQTGPAVGAVRAATAQADQQLQLEVTELKMSVDNLERERDFYYSKLREVEVLCQEHEGQDVPFLAEVLAILYKTDEESEFVSPEDEIFQQ